MFSSGCEKPRDDFVQDPAFGFSTTASSRSMTISCNGSRVEVSGCFSSSMFCAPGQATMRLFLEEEKKGGLGVAVGARTLSLPFARDGSAEVRRKVPWRLWRLGPWAAEGRLYEQPEFPLWPFSGGRWSSTRSESC